MVYLKVDKQRDTYTIIQRDPNLVSYDMVSLSFDELCYILEQIRDIVSIPKWTNLIYGKQEAIDVMAEDVKQVELEKRVKAVKEAAIKKLKPPYDKCGCNLCVALSYQDYKEKKNDKGRSKRKYSKNPKGKNGRKRN